MNEFEDIGTEITRKFVELKLWVSNIPSDSTNIEFATISKGLFFVYLYGIYEEIVRKTICATVYALNDSSIKIGDCKYELYAVLLSPEFDALYSVGNEKKWEKRWDIANKLLSNTQIDIQPDLFPTDGRNIRIRQLQSIANSFGLKGNVLPRNETGGYVQELVDMRNNIAHGNKLPREIGRNYTQEDLLKRCDILSEVCTYVVSMYEKYIVEKSYLKTAAE